MKKIKVFSIIIFTLLLVSSCEKRYTITKTYKDKVSDKPVGGLVVGLYKYDNWLGYNKSVDSIKLVATGTTDSFGRVVFEVENENIQNYFFNPIQTTDTTLVNAKFNFVFSADLPTASWDKNAVIYLYSQYDIKVRIKNMEMNDQFKLKYNEQVYNLLMDGSPYFHILLSPGQYHNLEFYSQIGDRMELKESKSIYVKYQSNKSKYVFGLEIPRDEIIIELSN